MPSATAPWALDSGGFTELSQFGRWTVEEDQYADEIQRWSEQAGMLAWAAPMDWMCEPWVVEKTGLSVAEHQRRTIDSYLSMKGRGLPVIPILQGWELGDYLDHAEQYQAAGIDLRAEPVVGVGSVCRRQAMGEAERIMRALSRRGLSLHGFGFKKTGLRRCADAMASADSMAWSFAARRKQEPLPGCTKHKNCANCLRFALQWRAELLAISVPADAEAAGL